ncbi:MAG: class F420-dependent enzyme [Nocardia sp.]|uniref:pyridoxamine 5'-phosphate oxidase family protein n=1 Tax=Nocardia sp. TaxID=1821 RepID=UPI002628118E|nr:TIGR03618 family F420-dependent PPOX class oxidoreductase [Nocardia sp.]MCU1640160.1 class F420-dependent enzyme [Nocardia sp.]
MSKNQGPAPRSLTEEELITLIGAQQFGVLATVKRSGHPAMSTVLYRWDPTERVIHISTTAERLKAKQVRNDSRVSLHVSGPDVWSFAVAEGDAEVSDSPEELLAYAGYPAASSGYPEDAAAFLAEQRAEGRVVIAIKVARLYGTALDVS